MSTTSSSSPCSNSRSDKKDDIEPHLCAQQLSTDPNNGLTLLNSSGVHPRSLTMNSVLQCLQYLQTRTIGTLFCHARKQSEGSTLVKVQATVFQSLSVKIGVSKVDVYVIHVCTNVPGFLWMVWMVSPQPRGVLLLSRNEWIYSSHVATTPSLRFGTLLRPQSATRAEKERENDIGGFAIFHCEPMQL